MIIYIILDFGDVLLVFCQPFLEHLYRKTYQRRKIKYPDLSIEIDDVKYAKINI